MAKKEDDFELWKFAQKRDEWMRRLAALPASEMPSGAKVVAFRLALYMHEFQRRAFPSHKALGVACGMSDRMVQGHIEKLSEWIYVDHKRNRGNTYWLKYPFLDGNGNLVPLLTESDVG